MGLDIDEFYELPIFLVACLGIGALFHHYSNPPKKTFPDNVKQGYVAPSELELISEDLDKTDGKGIPESYLKVGEKRYVVKYDVKGKPALFEYRYRPGKVLDGQN